MVVTIICVAALASYSAYIIYKAVKKFRHAKKTGSAVCCCGCSDKCSCCDEK